MSLPAASISIDLDNAWAYLRTQGAADWAESQSYLELVVPRILQCLDRHAVKATFFIVGRDAELQPAIIHSIAEAGHEIGNHSFNHEPWLHRYSQEDLEAEFDRTEAALLSATGQRPLGFRGPGFSTSPAVLELMRRRGYAYDASAFPTIISPLARLYFHLKSKLSDEEKAKRSGLYGGIGQAFRTLRPHMLPDGLIELPVSTLPLLRVPVHFTYLMFLAAYSPTLARLYAWSAMQAFRLANIAPSLLLHPTDFLDVSEVPAMGFFPGMKVPVARKITIVDSVLRSMTQHWQVGTCAAHASTASVHASHGGRLPLSNRTPLKTQL
jgi:peptidoglycan-N-acetylglucosamine deacetylase